MLQGNGSRSSVVVGTGQGAERSGDKLTFFAPKHVDQLNSSVEWVCGRSITSSDSGVVTLTIHLHLVPRLVNKRSYTSTRLQDLIACTGTTQPSMRVVLLVIPVLFAQKRDDEISLYE